MISDWRRSSQSPEVPRELSLSSRPSKDPGRPESLSDGREHGWTRFAAQLASLPGAGRRGDVAECVAASVYPCAVDRAHRAPPQRGRTSARDHDEVVM